MVDIPKLTRQELSQFARSQRAIRFFENLESAVGVSGATLDDLLSFLSTVRVDRTTRLERRIEALEVTLPGRASGTHHALGSRIDALEASVTGRRNASLERRVKAIEDYLGVGL